MINLPYLLMQIIHELYTHGTHHMQTKRRLAEISDAAEFERVLDNTILTREERETVKLAMVEGMTYWEISDILHIGEHTARRRFNRALAKIEHTI